MRGFANTAISAVLLCVVLSGCQSAPAPTAQPAQAQAPLQAIVATIRQAGRVQADELQVQPLREQAVEDLRSAAQVYEGRGDYAAAAEALQEALSISADDPLLLQELAEIKVLAGEFEQAQQLALQAWELGAKLGPLCRRHWATIRQVRYLAHDAEGADISQRHFDACRVGPPPRF